MSEDDDTTPIWCAKCGEVATCWVGMLSPRCERCMVAHAKRRGGQDISSPAYLARKRARVNARSAKGRTRKKAGRKSKRRNR